MSVELHTKTIQSIIAQVKLINEKYDAIKKATGENFNIFSILNVERKEVETHSFFLYELLNPQGSHNQEELYLKLFLEIVLELSDYGAIKNVYREKVTSENRRIDFVIETEKYQIGIEMKIDAGDQKDQLKDYIAELELANKTPKLYYLTLMGTPASEDSGDENIYEKLSFSYDIYEWIGACMEKSVSLPIIREGLAHYKNLIAKLTGNISNSMEKEMKELLRTPQDMKAVQILLNEYPKIWAQKEYHFFEKVRQRVNSDKKFYDVYGLWLDDNEEFLNQSDVVSNIIKNRATANSSVGYAYWIPIKTYGYISLEISSQDNAMNLYIAFHDTKEDYKNSTALFEIAKNMGFTNPRKTNYRFKEVGKIGFYSKSNPSPSYELFDETQFDKLVSMTAEEINNAIKAIYEMNYDIISAYENK